MNTINLIAIQAINTTSRARFFIYFWLTSLFSIALPAYAALPITQWTHASGAQIFLVHSPAIPMVDVQIDFDAGSRRDPADKAGLASSTSLMLSKGVKVNGTQPALNDNQLSEAWADLGASFSAHASDDRMSFHLRSLTYPDLLPKATLLAARPMGQSTLPTPIWLRERARLVANIKEQNTRPATLATRAFAQPVYGRHPYGFEATEASLNRITPRDMQALLNTQLLACRAKVSVVGALTKAQAEELASTVMKFLPQASSTQGTACPTLPVVDEVKPLAQAVDKRIPFNAAQAQVFIGQPGYKRDDPDFFALLVGNHILGGGAFTSRLTNEVREKRGLTYSVYSYFAPGSHAGAFTIGLQTRPDQATQAVQVSKDVLKDFVANGPTEAELKAAKDNLIGGFALRIDSNEKLLGNVANIAWNNLPLNYLDVWTQQIDKITAAQIKAAMQRKLQPEKMVTVVLGGSN